MLSLRWGRIDFTRSSLYIAESMGIDKDERTRPKWQSARPLPMAPQLAHLLAAWGPDDAGEDDLVFPSPLGGKLDGSALRRRFVTARDKAGLQPLPFHALRHTFASLAVAIDVVARPDHVEQDQRPERRRYFGRDLGPSRWLVVVVSFEQDPGRVITSWASRKDPKQWKP